MVNCEYIHNFHINCVDFEKVFDSVDMDIIWRLMIPYGIPPELINIIQDL